MGLHKGYLRSDLTINILNNTPKVKGKYNSFVVVFLSVNHGIMSKYNSVREMHEDSKNTI